MQQFQQSQQQFQPQNPNTGQQFQQTQQHFQPQNPNTGQQFQNPQQQFQPQQQLIQSQPTQQQFRPGQQQTQQQGFPNRPIRPRHPTGDRTDQETDTSLEIDRRPISTAPVFPPLLPVSPSRPAPNRITSFAQRQQERLNQQLRETIRNRERVKQQQQQNLLQQQQHLQQQISSVQQQNNNPRSQSVSSTVHRGMSSSLGQIMVGQPVRIN